MPACWCISLTGLRTVQVTVFRPRFSVTHECSSEPSAQTMPRSVLGPMICVFGPMYAIDSADSPSAQER